MTGFFTWTAVTVIVAAFTALIQERRLSFDLFNKRYETYKNLANMFENCIQLAYNYKDDEEVVCLSFNTLLDRMDNEMINFEFLFSEKISQKIEKLISAGHE